MVSAPFQRILIVAAVFVPLLLAQTATEARRPRASYPSLTGTWKGTYTTNQGGTGTLDVNITSDTTEAGVIEGTLQDDKDSEFPGPVLTLSGTVSKKKAGKKPKWKTTATGDGIVSNKIGKLVNNNKITGTYNDNPGGTGTFVLNRLAN